jgi:hypothetical protein
VNHTFCVTVNDPDGDTVFCLWDWGDGTSSGWLGPYTSGEEICVTHAWSNEGSFDIQVKLRDEYGAESEWSETFTILIDETAPDLHFITPKKGYLYLWGEPRLPIFFTTIVIGSITVDVFAVDNGSGMSHVEFYLDGDLQTTDYTRQNNTYSWTWDERGLLFPYLLGAKAYDLAGNSASIQMRVWKIF